jgi:lipid-A-disaccharide synthase-like uncharacterized protein
MEKEPQMTDGTKTATLSARSKFLAHFQGVNNQLGWAGVVLLQGATLPAMFSRLFGGTEADLPPVSMVLLVWTGLILYLIRAIRQRDVVYIVSNAIGAFLNSVLLALIVFP